MKMDIKFVIGFAVFCMSLLGVQSSAGDRSQFFVNCMKGCLYSNCTEGNVFHKAKTTSFENLVFSAVELDNNFCLPFQSNLVLHRCIFLRN